jgi:hypothetical protein
MGDYDEQLLRGRRAVGHPGRAGGSRDRDGRSGGAGAPDRAAPDAGLVACEARAAGHRHRAGRRQRQRPGRRGSAEDGRLRPDRVRVGTGPALASPAVVSAVAADTFGWAGSEARRLPGRRGRAGRAYRRRAARAAEDPGGRRRSRAYDRSGHAPIPNRRALLLHARRLHSNAPGPGSMVLL